MKRFVIMILGVVGLAVLGFGVICLTGASMPVPSCLQEDLGHSVYRQLLWYFQDNSHEIRLTGPDRLGDALRVQIGQKNVTACQNNLSKNGASMRYSVRFDLVLTNEGDAPVSLRLADLHFDSNSEILGLYHDVPATVLDHPLTIEPKASQSLELYLVVSDAQAVIRLQGLAR